MPRMQSNTLLAPSESATQRNTLNMRDQMRPPPVDPSILRSLRQVESTPFEQAMIRFANITVFVFFAAVLFFTVLAKLPDRPPRKAAAPAKKAKAPAKKKQRAADDDAPAGKKKRAKKDPNAPKKALSAFMIFSMDKRAQVLADNPGIAFTDVAKKIGELWKQATADDKAPYEERARQDKERYKNALAEYTAGGGGGGDDAEDMEEE